jgi:hypothetical protein
MTASAKKNALGRELHGSEGIERCNRDNFVWHSLLIPGLSLILFSVRSHYWSPGPLGAPRVPLKAFLHTLLFFQSRAEPSRSPAFYAISHAKLLCRESDPNFFFQVYYPDIQYQILVQIIYASDNLTSCATLWQVLLHGATYNHKYWDIPANVDNSPHSFAK